MTDRRAVLTSCAVIVTAVVGAWLLPGARVGMGVAVVAVAIAASVLLASLRRPRGLEIGYGLLALALVATTVVRSAQWVVAVNLVAAAALSGMAVMGARSWRGSLAAPLAVLARLPRVPRMVVAPVARLVADRDLSGAAPVLRGTAAGVALVVVFGGLFWSADAAFARIAGSVLVPDWKVTLLPYRITVFACVALICGGLMEARLSRADAGSPEGTSWEASWGGKRRALTGHVATPEWVIPVLVVDLLFAAFVAVQITVLFGGRHHVLVTEGLTYAEYARQGFFQLLAAAALVLGMVAVVVHVGRPRHRIERLVMQGLLGALCGLTAIVLISALLRLRLYEETYGLTRLRISVHATIFWLMGIFALVMTAGAMWKASWLPRAVVAFTGAALLAFTLAGPDALIARRNVDRFEATGRIDLGYLSTLSEDAVPALMELPTPERDCVLSLLALRRDTGRADPWNGFNASRATARDVLSQLRLPMLGSRLTDACAAAGLDFFD